MGLQISIYVRIWQNKKRDAPIPTLFNSLIGLIKDTSLAANITILEMFMATQGIAARTYEPFIFK